MSTPTVVGSLVLVVVVVLLLVGAVRGDRANTQEHAELSTQIQKVYAAELSTQIQKVYAQVQNIEGDVKGLREETRNVKSDVKGLREETRAGFESLSKQISELNTNGSDDRDDAEN